MLVIIFLSVVIYGCGQGGQGGSSQPRKKPPVEDPPAPTAKVEIQTSLNLLKPKKHCRDAVQIHELPKTVTASHAELKKIPESYYRYLYSYKNDYSSERFFEEIGIAQEKETIEFRLKIPLGENESMNFRLDIGGILPIENEIVDEYHRSLEIKGRRILVHELGRVTELSDEYFTINYSEDGIQLRLLKPAIGPSAYYPLWWVAADNVDDERPNEKVIIPSLLEGNEGSIEVLKCSAREEENLVYEIFELDRNATEQTRENMKLYNSYFFQAKSHFFKRFPLESYRQGSFQILTSSKSVRILKDEYRPNNLQAVHSVKFNSIDPSFAGNRSRSSAYLNQLKLISQKVTSSYMSPSHNDLFSVFFTSIAPGFLEQYAGVAAKLDFYSREANYASTANKLGVFYSLKFKPRLLWGPIFIKPEVPNLTTGVGRLEELLGLHEDQETPAIDVELFRSSLDGWLNDKPYGKGFEPALLLDDDRDGLNTIFEEIVSRTDSQEMDTDDDGWSDYSEFLFKTPTNNPQVHPTRISADGTFREWVRLLRKKISVDPDIQSASCQKSQDITHFGIKSEGDKVAFGAQTAEELTIDSNLQGQWVVHVSVLDSKLEFMIKFDGLTHNYRIIESTTGKKVFDGRVNYWLGRQGMEIILNKNEVLSLLTSVVPDEVESYLESGKELKFKAKYTTYLKTNDYLICDETAWVQEDQ